MEKKQGRITLTDYYLRFHKLDNYSKILNRMTVSEVRLLIYIDAVLNKNEDAFALHNSEEVHNLFIEKLGAV